MNYFPWARELEAGLARYPDIAAHHGTETRALHLRNAARTAQDARLAAGCQAVAVQFDDCMRRLDAIMVQEGADIDSGIPISRVAAFRVAP